MLFHQSGVEGGRQDRSVRTQQGFLVYMGEVVSQLKVHELLAERVPCRMELLPRIEAQIGRREAAKQFPCQSYLGTTVRSALQSMKNAPGNDVVAEG